MHFRSLISCGSRSTFASLIRVNCRAMFTREGIMKDLKGGPHSLGDPENQTLLEIEQMRAIPAFQRKIINRDYCYKTDNEYAACREAYRWTKAVRCRGAYSAMKSCVKEHWDLPELRERATREYLEERTLYRLTGLKKSERNTTNHPK